MISHKGKMWKTQGTHRDWQEALHPMSADIDPHCGICIHADAAFIGLEAAVTDTLN